jgi:hypothetical protein
VTHRNAFLWPVLGREIEPFWLHLSIPNFTVRCPSSGSFLRRVNIDHGRGNGVGHSRWHIGRREYARCTRVVAHIESEPIVAVGRFIGVR